MAGVSTLSKRRNSDKIKKESKRQRAGENKEQKYIGRVSQTIEGVFEKMGRAGGPERRVGERENRKSISWGKGRMKIEG